LISFTEGLLPENHDPTSVVYQVLDAFDFQYLSTTMTFAWKLSRPKDAPKSEQGMRMDLSFSVANNGFCVFLIEFSFSKLQIRKLPKWPAK
jgi:hypothetical protein